VDTILPSLALWLEKKAWVFVGNKKLKYQSLYNTE